MTETEEVLGNQTLVAIMTDALALISQISEKNAAPGIRFCEMVQAAFACRSQGALRSSSEQLANTMIEEIYSLVVGQS